MAHKLAKGCTHILRYTFRPIKNEQKSQNWESQGVEGVHWKTLDKRSGSTLFILHYCVYHVLNITMCNKLYKIKNIQVLVIVKTTTFKFPLILICFCTPFCRHTLYIILLYSQGNTKRDQLICSHVALDKCNMCSIPPGNK